MTDSTKGSDKTQKNQTQIGSTELDPEAHSPAENLSNEASVAADE
jgi:hypothetical protein